MGCHCSGKSHYLDDNSVRLAASSKRMSSAAPELPVFVVDDDAAGRAGRQWRSCDKCGKAQRAQNVRYIQ